MSRHIFDPADIFAFDNMIVAKVCLACIKGRYITELLKFHEGSFINYFFRKFRCFRTDLFKTGHAQNRIHSP